MTTLSLDDCFTLSRLEAGKDLWHVFSMFTFKGVLHLNFSSVRMEWCFHGSRSEYQNNDSDRHSLIFDLLPWKVLFKFIQLCVRYFGRHFSQWNKTFHGQWFIWSHVTIQAFKLGKILFQLLADSPYSS